MNIYLPVEIKTRELESKILLSYLALCRGHQVLLGGKSDCRGLLIKSYLPPGIYHDKSITPSKSKIQELEAIKKNGSVVTSIDEESGLLKDDYNEFASARYGEATLQIVDTVFTWGEWDHSHLVRKFPQFIDKFVCYGSPRVDLWKSELVKCYNKRPLRERYILFASNLGGILDNKFFASIIKDHRESGYFDRGDGFEENLYKTWTATSCLLLEFVKLIRSLDETLNDVKIVVRPHPVETEEMWCNILGPIKNVIVTKQGSINYWVENAEALIHNGCTTAVEARVRGVPTLAYAPLEMNYNDSFPNKVSHVIASKEEMIRTCIEILNNNYSYDNSFLGIINKRFLHNQDFLAAEKMVDHWEHLWGNRKNIDISSFGVWYKIWLIKKIKYLYQVLFFILGKKRKKDRISDNKFPSLSIDELSSFLNKLESIFKKGINIKVRQMGDKSFLIYREE